MWMTLQQESKQSMDATAWNNMIWQSKAQILTTSQRGSKRIQIPNSMITKYLSFSPWDYLQLLKSETSRIKKLVLKEPSEATFGGETGYEERIRIPETELRHEQMSHLDLDLEHPSLLDLLPVSRRHQVVIRELWFFLDCCELRLQYHLYVLLWLWPQGLPARARHRPRHPPISFPHFHCRNVLNSWNFSTYLFFNSSTYWCPSHN